MNVFVQVLPLALLDTVSVATLAVPLWFLLTPGRLRLANVHRYLGLVAVGYFLMGCLLLAGFVALEDDVRRWLDSPTGRVALNVLGVALVLAAVWQGLRARFGRAADGEAADGGAGRVGRWREAAVGETATARGVVIIAAVAVLLELPTMFPYLLAVDTLGDSDLPTTARVGVLAGYCLVMVAPAVLLTVLRGLFQQALLPALQRVDDWFRRSAREDTAYLLAAAGLLVLSGTGLLDRAMDLLDQW